jgi:hypothetical protein
MVKVNKDLLLQDLNLSEELHIAGHSHLLYLISRTPQSPHFSLSSLSSFCVFSAYLPSLLQNAKCQSTLSFSSFYINLTFYIYSLGDLISFHGFKNNL